MNLTPWFKKIIKYLSIVVAVLCFSLFLSFVIEKFADIKDTFSGITTLVAIVVTFFIYEEQRKKENEVKIEQKNKENEVKIEQKNKNHMSAAKLVVMQIDHADSVIKLAKRDNKISITLPKFIGESEWDKNKHILVDRLDSTEMEIINTYFVACEQLEETRKITVNLQAEQLNAKARSIQHQLAEEIVRAQIDCNEYSQVDEINDILNKDVIPFSNRLDFLYKNQSFGEYEPQYFHNIFTQILNQKNIEIKGTAPYSKLRNIAGMG